MDSKSFRDVTVKSAAKGEVSAVFSAFNVVDKDDDVTEPDAFTDGERVVISAYLHTSWGGALPVGKGVIRTTDSEAILEGKFFMDTQSGRETFSVVKQLAEEGLGEWSYGFDIEESAPGKVGGKDVRILKRLKVHEVSPVLVGAGVNTRTLSVKSAGQPQQEKGTTVEFKRAIRPHETAVATKAWSGTELADAASVDDLRSVHAWVDGDPEAKGSYRFPHHDSPTGPANIRACLLGIADLNSVKGSGIPAEDHQAVYDHLAGHLRDADREPPELKTTPTATMKFSDEALSVVADASALINRATEVVALRSAKGRTPLSADSTDLLEWLGDELRRLKSLLTPPDDELLREYARFVKTTNRRAS